jgi:hypothetical protein
MQHIRSKAVVLGLLVAGAGALLYWRLPGKAGVADGSGDVDGRVWVEKRPDKHTDYVHVALFFSRANFGLFERASSYDMRLELADVTRKDDKLRVFFPQTGKDTTVTIRVKSCNDLPPFDLCLDLSDNPWGGPKRYYGFTNPEDEAAQLGDFAKEARLVAAAEQQGEKRPAPSEP